MAYEIERKFLVRGDYSSHVFKSFPFCRDIYRSPVPVWCGAHQAATRLYHGQELLVEGEITRHEWEYEIPLPDAREMLSLCGEGVIDKTRHLVQAGDHVFEVDEFHGENDGLVIAEVELESEGEQFERPHWLGEEVTGT